MINNKDSLGDRMKNYENSFKFVLPSRLPVILRVDGKAFHTYTKNCQKPFDFNLMEVMNLTAIELCKEIQGAQIAYIQSDEISILIHGYKNLNSQSWFNNEIQKMVSISAAIASSTFTANSGLIWNGKIKSAYFDSRIFIIPESEVCNYMLWRENDMVRNSIQMLARSLYSHKECNNKNCSELQEMCFQKEKNWNDLPTNLKRGRCVIKEYYKTPSGSDGVYAIRSKWIIDNEIPIFSQDRNYIEKYFQTE